MKRIESSFARSGTACGSDSHRRSPWFGLGTGLTSWAGELLVPAELAASNGFDYEDVGEAALKGVSEPVRLARVCVY